jgi:hypothetical protein
MPTRHGGSLAKNASTSLRLNFRATTTLPSASTPWTLEHLLCKVEPDGGNCCHGRPPLVIRLQRSLYGTQMPRGAPSTSSNAIALGAGGLDPHFWRANHSDLQRGDGRSSHLHYALHAEHVPRRQYPSVRRRSQGVAGGHRLHQQRQARRGAELPCHGRSGVEACGSARDPQRCRRALYDLAGERHEVRRLHGERRRHQTAPRSRAGPVLSRHPWRADS